MSALPDHRGGMDAYNPANMAGWWGMRPTSVAEKLSHGVSAALWTLNARTPFEIAAPADPETNVVSCIVAGSSSGEMSLNGRSHYRQTVSEGTFNLVRAGERPRAVLDWADCSILHLYVPRAMLQRAADDLFDGDAPQVELLPITVETDAAITAVAGAIVHEMKGPAPAARLMIDGLALQLTALLVRGWSNHARQTARRQGRSPPLKMDWRMRRAVEFLEARFSEDFSLDDVADAVGLSTNHFAALFREATSLTPHRWLVRRRVEHACEMLANPRRSITDIAHACGFASSQHLATTFKKQTGTTPTAYRRRLL